MTNYEKYFSSKEKLLDFMNENKMCPEEMGLPVGNCWKYSNETGDKAGCRGCRKEALESEVEG